MNQLLWRVTAFAISASAALAAGASAGADLLSNPGFEQADPSHGPPRGWTSYVPFQSAVVAGDSRAARSGTRSAMVETTSDLTAFLVSDPPSAVAPGETVAWSVWCRVGDLNTVTGGALQVNAAFIDSKGRTFEWDRHPVVPPALGQWFRIERTVVVPQRAAAMTLQLGMRSMTGSTRWDDAALRAQSTLAARFALPEGPLSPAETSAAVTLINRDPASRGKRVEIRTQPGGAVFSSVLTDEIFTTAPVTVRPGRRGSVTLSARVSGSATGGRDVVTSAAVVVPPLLVLEPLSPTHFVLEDGQPRAKVRLILNEPEEALRTASLRCVLRNTSGTPVMTWTEPTICHSPVSFIMELPVTPASLSPGSYELTVELLRNGKPEASESTDWHVIRRAQAQVALGADGNLVADGKPFFPLGLYMGKDFPELAEAGFNLMQSYPAFAGPKSSNASVKEFLDRTHAAGMKALTFISHGPERLNDEDSLRRIRMFRNHPATLVWYQEEAVDRGYKPLSYLENLYATLKREAPHFPVLQGDRKDVSAKMALRADFLPEDYMDLGIWWWYPTPLRSTPNTEGYEGEPTGPELEYRPPPFLANPSTKKPLWVALQCYKKPGVSDARFPTPDEYRAQAYIAICHGAKGLVYYTATGERGSGIQNLPEEGHWTEFKKLIGELRDLSPVFLAPDASAQTAVASKGAMVSVRTKQTPQGRVLLAVNRSIRPVEAIFEVPGLQGGGEAGVRGENRRVSIGADGKFGDPFGPYAVHIYEIK